MLRFYNMNSDLQALLVNFKVAKGDRNFTHTSRVNPKGSYYIGSNDDLKKFYTQLCKANALEEVYGLTEKPFPISPLRHDFDFRFTLEHGTRRVYTLETLKHIHKLYCKVIKESVIPSKFDERMLHCIISEKPKPRSSDGVIKDGIHFYFPNFYCDEWFMDAYLPSLITKLMKKDKLFQYEEYMEPIDKLIDRKIATKVWMMYGAVSNEKSNYYKVSHIFDSEQNEMSIQSAFPKFFNRKRPNKPEYYLPILMSIRRKGEVKATSLTDVVVAKKNVLTKRVSKKQKYVPRSRSEEDVMADLKRIDGDIMDMLSDDRTETWDEWMGIGWALFSISQGNDKGLEMWIEFSKRSSKYKMGECEELWDKMDLRPGKNGHGITIGTILRMARLDNPDAYNEWREDNVEYMMEDVLMLPKPTHYRVAKVLHKCYEGMFVCSKSKGDMWYEYRENSWHYVDDGVAIKRLLPTIIGQKFSAYCRKLDQQRNSAVTGGQGGDAKRLQDKISKVWKVIEFVENKQNINNCVDLAKLEFYQENFHQQLDMNCWLVGDQNGVYDLKNGKHRAGSPDDKISRQLGVPYIDYSWNDPEVLNVIDFLEKVFPNPAIREYFIKSTASCLQAGNVNKKCYIWTNDSGDNAKTITLELVEMIFGDYFMNFDRSRFLKNTIKSAGGPAPDVKRMIGRRVGAVKELAKNEQMDIGFLKFVTGNDSMFVRSHHEEGEDIKPQLTTIIMCNHPPRIPGNDQATWNRLRIIPFESRFIHDAPEDPEEQKRLKLFPVDTNFRLKLPDMASAFYWVMLQKFKEYLKDGLVEPREVTIDTEKYKTENDIFMQFACDKIRKTGRTENMLSLNMLWPEFKEWHNENYPSYRKSNLGKLHFKHEMVKGMLGKADDRNRWYGFVLKDDDIGEDDGEESLDME